MSHMYYVQSGDGRSHEVSTQHNHGDHSEQTFAKHLLDVIKQCGAQIVAGIVVNRHAYDSRR